MRIRGARGFRPQKEVMKTTHSFWWFYFSKFVARNRIESATRFTLICRKGRQLGGESDLLRKTRKCFVIEKVRAFNLHLLCRK